MVSTNIQAYFKREEQYLPLDTNHMIAVEGYKGYLDFKCVETEQTCSLIFEKNHLNVNSQRKYRELDSFKVYAKPLTNKKMQKYSEIDPDMPILINLPKESGFVIDIGVMSTGGVGPKLDDERLLSMYGFYSSKNNIQKPVVVAVKDGDELIMTDVAKKYNW